MKKRYVGKLLEALKSASICKMNSVDRNALLDNVIAFSEEQELLEKIEKAIINKLKPKKYDELSSSEQQLAVAKFNEEFSAYMESKYSEDTKVLISPLSESAMDLLFEQNEITTEGKALIRRFLK